MLIKLILIGLAIYFLYRTVGSPPKRGAQREKPAASGPQDTARIDDIMIKDPVCEVYFPRRQGVHLRIDSQDYFFCSPECRDEFAARYRSQHGNGA